MSASRTGYGSRSITASRPCWRGTGPIAAHCSSVTPSTTNSANEPASSGTPSAAYSHASNRRADDTMVWSTSRTDRCAVTARTAELTACSSARSHCAPVTFHTVPTRMCRRPRSMVPGPRTEAAPGRGPMAAGARVPSVGGMPTEISAAPAGPSGTPVAIVTGASRGLGLALATGLASAGWRLVVDARTAGPLTGAAAGLAALTTVVALPGDVTDPAHRRALADAADRLGGPDLLVNNAGILGPSPQPPLADYPPAALLEVYEVNVVAPLALAQAVLPGLRR